MAKTTKAMVYSIYVLILLLIAYLLNQLDRYMISICTKPMAQDIHYGTQACMENSSYTSAGRANCTVSIDKASCALATDKKGEHACEWNYNGQGIEYEILAGPVFIVVYTIAGIPLGFLADVYNRKNILAVLLTFWSLMTVLTGLAKEYWHLAILRFALGIGQAGCTPLATSLIADYFDVSQRAAAIGVYNWGIYFGYSLAYAVGNFVTEADILGQGWRWAFYVSGIPGLIVGPLMFLSVKEPERQGRQEVKDSADTEGLLGSETEVTCGQKVLGVLKAFFNPSLLILCLAGSLRNAAGYVWAYNTQVYYESLGQTAAEIGTYMSWIPLVGGSIGVVLGGFLSDRVVKRIGPYARIIVIIVSQVLAAPFVAGALYLDPPYAYLILIPGYIFGEMWVGITLTVVVELVPTRLRTAAVAVYLFIISNIGGNIPLLVPSLQTAFMSIGYTTLDALRASLYILYPGLYIAGAFFYFITLLVMRWDLKRVQTSNYNPIEEEVGNDENE